MAGRIKYWVFDVESVPDGNLLHVTVHKDQKTPKDAIEAAKAEALRKSDNERDFIPLPYHLPIVCVVLGLDTSLTASELHVFIAQKFSPFNLVEQFWDLVGDCEAKFVTYNGRSYDLPLMELMALRDGISVPHYFGGKYGPRNRYADAHIDLHEFFTNYGGAKLYGGLNTLAKALMLPGKSDVDGGQVASLYNLQKLDVIADYCTEDVLNTYFVFLRSRVLTGTITLAQEAEIRQNSAAYFKSLESGACHSYISKLNNAGLL